MNTSVVADERVSPDEKAAAKRSIAPKEKVAAAEKKATERKAAAKAKVAAAGRVTVERKVSTERNVASEMKLAAEGTSKRRRRAWLIARREKLGYTREELAALCGCSAGLVRIVEEGGVTHPRIAARLIRRCGLGLDAFNAIVPVERRADMLPIALPPPQDEDFTWKGIARMFRAMHAERKNVEKQDGVAGRDAARDTYTLR